MSPRAMLNCAPPCAEQARSRTDRTCSDLNERDHGVVTLPLSYEATRAASGVRPDGTAAPENGDHNSDLRKLISGSI